MKKLLLSFLLCTIGLANSQAQSKSIASLFEQDGLWLYADSGLTMQRLTRANALLLVQWSPEDATVEDLAIGLKDLQKKHSWLTVVGVISNERTYQSEPKYLDVICTDIGWEFPLFISTDKVWPDSDHWAFELYQVGGELVTSSTGFNNLLAVSSAIESLANRIQKANMQVNPSYAYQSQKTLEDLNLFKAASDIEVDPSYEFLFISDTGHDRIVVCDLDGKVQNVIGTGDKGKTDGELLDATFNHPSGLAYDADKRLLYVADRGNNLIRVVDMDRLQVSTLYLTNLKGKDYVMSSSPERLTLSGSLLTIACPGSSEFIQVDLATKKVSSIFGMEEKGYEIEKNPFKSQLTSASYVLKENESFFFYDQNRGNLYKTDKLKNSVLLTEDSLLSVENKALYASDLHHLLAPIFHEGRILAWNSETASLIEIDPYSYTVNEFPLDLSKLQIGRITGMRSAKGTLYLLDGSTGRVFLSKGKDLRSLAFSNKDRLMHVQSSSDIFLHAPDVLLAPEGQTNLILKPILPPHFSFDPQTPSYIYVNGNDPAVVLSDGNLRQQEILLTLFPDLNSNQINLMAELNFCEKTDPTRCYQRWVTVNIPVLKDDAPEQGQEIDLELFKGL
jgi:DNA-binding beta-propeller fold protein YncE